MARLGFLVVVLAAAGVVGWLLIGLDAEPGPAGVPRSFGDAPRPEDEVLSGPRLEGVAARAELPDDEGTPGEYSIRGLVRDERGAPVAGVRILAARHGEARWGIQRWNTDPNQSVLRDAQRLHSGQPTAQLPQRETRSDGDGIFEFKLDRSGEWRVLANPEAPLAGTYQVAWASPHWPHSHVTLWVLSGSALQGRVLDAKEQGAAGVQVVATWSMNDMGRQDFRRFEAEATTDAEGRFAIPAVPAGVIHFALWPGGGLSASGYSTRAPTEQEVVLRLPSGGGVVEGLVHGPDGVGVTGAQVVLSVAPPQAEGKPADEKDASTSTTVVAQSDAQGRYRATGLPSGTVTVLQAAAQGFLPVHWTAKAAELEGKQVSDAAALSLDVGLRRGSTLSGTVRSAGDERAIAGAEVLLYPTHAPGTPRGPRRTVSAADGSYSFSALEEGRWLIVPDHPEFVDPELGFVGTQQVLRPGQAQSTPAGRTLVVSAEDQPMQKDLLLARGVRVRGRVLTGGNDPVAGATVHAHGMGIAQQGWQWGVQLDPSRDALAESNAQGEFTTRALPAGQELRLLARKQGLLSRIASSMSLSADAAPPEVTLVLETGASIRGRVLDADGKGLPGVQIYTWAQNEALESYNRNNPISDGNGHFEVQGVLTGTVQLHAHLPGRLIDTLTVEGLVAGEVREGVEIRVRAGGEVSGRLELPDGGPAAGVLLYIQVSVDSNSTMLHAQTDAEGRFSVGGVADGARCQLMLPRGTTIEGVGSAFAAPKSDVFAVYQPPKRVTIKGRVLDDKGEPVPLFQVLVTAANEDSGMRSAWQPGGGGQDGINGAFERSVEGDPPYRVQVSRPRTREGAPMNLQGVDVPVADPGQPLEVRLVPGRSVRGKVVDAAGQPVPGVLFSVKSHEATSLADGTFQLVGLPEGALSASIEVPSEYVNPGSVALGTQSTPITLTLQRGLTISGRVFLADGEPASGGGVSAGWQPAQGGAAGNSWAQFEGDGRFTVRGLPEGARVELTARVWSPKGEQLGQKRVPDVLAGSQDVEIRLAPGVEISGRVLDHAGKGVSGCYVWAQDGRGGHANAVQPDDQGRFTLRGLEAGEWTVQVQMQGGGLAPPSQKVQAPASGVELRLPASAALTGRVLDLGADAASFSLVSWKEGAGDAQGPTGKVNADGTFRIEHFPGEGRWQVGVWREGDRRYACSAVFECKGDPIDLRLRAVEGVTIAGRVLGPKGEAAARSLTTFTGPGWRCWARPDGEGRFESPGMPAGAYRLRTRASGFRADSREGVATGTTGLEIVLEPGR